MTSAGPGGGQVFLGRQPIFDRRRAPIAYEILFRHSAEAQVAKLPASELEAATRVIVNTFCAIGPEFVLGGRLGFFNVSRDALLSDAIEALPREEVVLEILESVEPDAEVRRRCAELRRAGFRLALDDYVRRDPREDLLGVVDYVKVDLQQTEGFELRTLVRTLRNRSLRLVAEKVETEEQFEECRKLGFDLFQGFHLSRPVVVSGRNIDPARQTLIELLRALSADPSPYELAETFKGNADLSVNLLRLVNSAAFARSNPIASVQHALVFLGTRHLRRWVTLLLFAGADPRGWAGPLLQRAATRARMMEGLVSLGEAAADGEEGDVGFLVGLLSLLGALLNVSDAEALEQLPLEEGVRRAVLEREGFLGRRLGLIEALEALDVGATAKLLDELGIPEEDLRQCQAEAFRFTHRLESEGASA